jgi:hypothetical protein
MKRLLAVLALAMALPVFAQQQDAAALQRKRAAIAELLSLIDLKAAAAEALSMTHKDDRDREVRKRLAQSLDANHLTELYTPQLEQLFTEPEVQQMVAFFKTPAGAKSLQLFKTVYSAQLAETLLSGQQARAIADQLEQENADPAMVTMERLRALATATEAYAVDYNAYPRGDLAALRPLLEPTYIRQVPVADGWGNEFFYVSDGARYRFASAGSDGRFQWDTRALSVDAMAVEQTESPESDIIFEDGNFVRAPRSAIQQQEY